MCHGCVTDVSRMCHGSVTEASRMCHGRGVGAGFVSKCQLDHGMHL